jgi:DivIVA domain-containing protein
MTWFFAVLIVALLGAVAVVAAGAGGSQVEVYDDRADSRVQADGPLRGEDLRQVRFTTAFRGYRMSEVDSLLDRLAAELELRDRVAADPEAAGSRQPDTEAQARAGPDQAEQE